ESSGPRPNACRGDDACWQLEPYGFESTIEFSHIDAHGRRPGSRALIKAWIPARNKCRNDGLR
ncbi:MAG TPA: hypothetical protein PKV86_07070, partial [Syntrophobacteraceae bacterium]|nr:hypothetical protein [Syntrophobacteraceae bacterium]